MKAIKTLDFKEMEMVNGGEAMEACDACDAIEEFEEIEECEAFDPCEAVAAGQRRVRVKRYKKIKVNGVMRNVPYYTWKTV